MMITDAHGLEFLNPERVKVPSPEVNAELSRAHQLQSGAGLQKSWRTITKLHVFDILFVIFLFNKVLLDGNYVIS